MGLASVHANLRAAFRERLLTLTDVDHSPGVSVSLSGGVFTRASGSWLDAGFARGMEVQAIGFAGDPRGIVSAVTATQLTTSIAGSQTLSGGGRFLVGLPIGRAWEGESFFPVDNAPYVAESFRAGTSRGLSVGNGDGTGGAVQHLIEASATFFYPKGYGTLAIERMAAAALVLFRRAAVLSRGGDSARIENCERGPLYDDGSRIGCAITAILPAYTFN